MIEAVIIDDEPSACKTLKLLLEAHCPDVWVSASYCRPDEALAHLLKQKPQLIFLDIEMPVLDGFSFLDKLQPKNIGIIFTTAYDQFALKAFRYSAFDYLLKPIDVNELITALERFKAMNNPPGTDHLQHLLGIYKNINNQLPQKIAFPTLEGFEFIHVNSIIHCESNDNYTILHLTENLRPLMVSRTLKEVEQALSEQSFYRIHHSHLINKNHIEKILKADGGFVQMSNGQQLPIARRRKNEILEELTGL